ncbi:MAG: dihydropteroate synthase [Bacteroidales bacterium]|nr:dihydropteroate synthase [Candidatus Physcousia equi]
MISTQTHTLNLHGRLLNLSMPRVMGILNVTPDSFYAASRKQTEEAIIGRVSEIMLQGGDIVDIGAYSSRPGAADVSPEEEMERLARALSIIRHEYPQVIISVDTFRASVAARCVEQYGVDIINDISGGELDKEMFPTVARLQVPYILMHMQGTPQNMQDHPQYRDVVSEVLQYLGRKVDELHELGVNDIILDPGYGFGKTLEQNCELLRMQHSLLELNLPILVGVSRKSMIYRILGNTPEEALNGTTVLHTMSLLQGANILRVHDVREAVEACRIVKTITSQPHNIRV